MATQTSAPAGAPLGADVTDPMLYASDSWRPVFDKMAHIVDTHLQGWQVDTLYLSGGSCAMPGVRELFAQRFPQLEVILPQPPLFLTPLAIAAHGLAGAYAEVQA